MITQHTFNKAMKEVNTEFARLHKMIVELRDKIGEMEKPARRGRPKKEEAA